MAQKTGIDIPEPMLDQLAEFMEFHTEARYPDVATAFYRKCTKDFAMSKFQEIKEVHEWFLKKLEK